MQSFLNCVKIGFVTGRPFLLADFLNMFSKQPCAYILFFHLDLVVSKNFLSMTGSLQVAQVNYGDNKPALSFSLEAQKEQTNFHHKVYFSSLPH